MVILEKQLYYGEDLACCGFIAYGINIDYQSAFVDYRSKHPLSKGVYGAEQDVWSMSSGCGNVNEDIRIAHWSSQDKSNWSGLLKANGD